jgi:hypothetical protein
VCGKAPVATVGAMTTTLAAPTEAQLPITSKHLGFNTWQKDGEGLIRSLRANEAALETNQWEIGDWIVEGVEQFGKQKAYDAAEEITGFDRTYLQTVVWVVKRFDSSLRKETKLKWSHFKELAYIKDDDLRGKVLRHFSDGGDWSVRAVREHVREELDKLKGQNSGKKPKASKHWESMQVSLKKGYREQIKELAKIEDEAPDELLGRIVMEYFEEHKKDIIARIEKAKKKKSKR